MYTRVLMVVAAACVLGLVLLVWKGGGGGGRPTVQPLAPDSPEAAELAAWVRAVRGAPEGSRAEAVTRTFDESVEGVQRRLRAAQVVEAVGRIAAEKPAAIEAHGGAVWAVWATPPGDGGDEGAVVLLFRRRPDGSLRLLGPMP